MNSRSFVFANNTEEPLFLVIDPPCGEWEILPQTSLRLIVDESVHLPDPLIAFRFHGPNCINVDVDINSDIFLEIDAKREKIWG